MPATFTLAVVTHDERKKSSNSRSFISESNFNDKTWDGFLKLLEYVRLDVQAAPDFSALAKASRAGAQRVFYLSTAPSLFTTICDKLAASNLVDANARVVLEKPLGTDLASAIAINRATPDAPSFAPRIG